MYNAEVLSKFPVIQHFPFGSLFSFAKDPKAVVSSPSLHIASHSCAPSQPEEPPKATAILSANSASPMKAPWTNVRGTPTISSNRLLNPRSTQRPLQTVGPGPSQGMQMTPRHTPGQAGHALNTSAQDRKIHDNNLPTVPSGTKAPWAS